MENRVYRYECVFAQASFQFCGHIDDYLIENARQVGLLYFQTRFGKGRHLFRCYEEGRLVEERELSFAPSCLGYYMGLWRHWNRELNAFRRGKAEVTAIFTHPLLAFGKMFRRNVRTFFWQWDYFPDASPKSRLFNAFARFYAPRCTVYRPLTHAIGKAVGLPDAPPLMLGVRPPARFGDPQSSRLLLVGQLRKGQGVEAVLDFLVRTPDCSLSLMGAAANGFGDEIRRRIAEGNLEGRVFFPDRFVSEGELRDEAAKCLAALALYETSANNLTHYADPGKVKSAIEMGLPVVMTRISEIVPFVERFHAGEVIDSVAALPAALAKIRRAPAAYFDGCRAFAAHFDYRMYDLPSCRPSARMKLLYVDHACHRATASADFFAEILRSAFAVTEHRYQEAYRTGAKAAMRGQDGAVIWEFPIARGRFYFPGKVNVFVPMYDNEWGSVWQWRRLAASGMGVVSFCGKVSAHARRCGVTNLLDVRYFPDPAALPQTPGDLKRVFLWERGGVSRAQAEKMFPTADGYVLDVKGASEFLPRAEYLARVAACGAVIAPRRKEGIGMAFLEAMAMGKCVVAHNDATMNEYIIDGESGLLVDFDRPARIAPERVARARAGVAAATARHRARWVEDAAKIVPFVQSLAPCRPGLAARAKIALEYSLYLAEGAWWRLRHG